jgi:ATP-dependent Clp endopeptidase proteolytic subunit ClpP
MREVKTMKVNVKGTIIPNDDQWIYDLFDIDATSPAKVSKGITAAAEKGEPLEVYINSGGGDIFAASEIYSAIREYSGDVKIHVVGLAASAASVIACAGKSDISPTAQIMVHNVSSATSGDYHDMDKMSEILQKANETIANAYITKSGMTKEKALEIMDKETWLTADEAVELGLIDEVAGSKNVKSQLVAAYCDIIPQNVIERMKAERADKKITAQARLDKLKEGYKNDKAGNA